MLASIQQRVFLAASNASTNTNGQTKMASPSPGKLRLMALHSFRTSAEIFREQMRRSGLDKKLENLVYIDAPHEASGPPLADVAPFFEPPYREWWNATTNKEGDFVYIGAEETLAFVKRVLTDEGPFDGVWAFSQGTMLGTIVMSLQRQGIMFEDCPRLEFAVLFGGFHAKERLKRNKMAQKVFPEGTLLDIPSVHIVGDRDSIRDASLALMEAYKDPLLITHPQGTNVKDHIELKGTPDYNAIAGLTMGHTIPTLEGDKFKALEDFLKERQEHKTPATRRRSGSSSGDSKL